MRQVTIRHSGNILQVDPPMEEILGPALTYKHRKPIHGFRPGKKIRHVEIIPTPVYNLDGGKLYCLVGLLERVMKHLRKAGCKVRYKRVGTFKKFEPDYEALQRKMPDLAFRPGQAEVLGLIIERMVTQVQAPPGWGKSFLVQCLSFLYPDARVVVAVPSVTLLNSMYNDLMRYSPDVGRVGDSRRDIRRVTVTTMQSLGRIDPSKCDIFVFDEAHRAGGAGVAETVACFNKCAKCIGFSATPEGRSDGGNLPIEALFGPIVYRVSYEEAEASGSVVPVNVRMVSLPAEAVSEDVISREGQGRPAKKRTAIWNNDFRTKLLAREALRTDEIVGAKDSQVLVLVETLSHALNFLKFLPDFTLVYGAGSNNDIPAYVAAGLLPDDYEPLTSKERTRLAEAFKAGELKRVIATGVWGTGLDMKYLRHLVYASGEPGNVPVVQWGGRVTRTNKEGKVEGWITDCLDEFDPWARGRANRRVREYRGTSWRVIRIKA